MQKSDTDQKKSKGEKMTIYPWNTPEHKYKDGEKFNISDMPTDEEIATVLGCKINEIKDQGHAPYGFHEAIVELRKSRNIIKP